MLSNLQNEQIRKAQANRDGLYLNLPQEWCELMALISQKTTVNNTVASFLALFIGCALSSGRSSNRKSVGF